MVATAVPLAVGSCAGLAPTRAEKSFLPKGEPHQLRSHCSPRISINKPHQLLLSQTPSLQTFPITRAVALDSDQLGSSESPDKEKPRRYHFVVANAKFMLDEEEHFQEVLFERRRLFGERNREQDFWLVIEPKFLDRFPNITKRLKRPAVALVSTDATWITFMKLRLDRVLCESYEAESMEEALASNPVDLHFEKPKNWVAPYPKYEPGWWETFLPPGSSTPKEQ